MSEDIAAIRADIPVLRLTGEQMGSIEPPLSGDWFCDFDEYEEFVPKAALDAAERDAELNAVWRDRAQQALRAAEAREADIERFARLDPGIVWPRDGVTAQDALMEAFDRQREAAQRLCDAIGDEAAVKGLAEHGHPQGWKAEMDAEDATLCALQDVRALLDGQPRPHHHVAALGQSHEG